MTNQKTTHISDEKKKAVLELVNLIKTKKTILIASIKGLPTSQFQEIGKKLRSNAVVKVPKKNLMLKAIEQSKDENVLKLKDYIKESSAVLFSDSDSFDLAFDLIKNKSPSKAKAGQEAPEDIEIQPGPTDLVPGPAISELGALGIKIQIEGGKIAIKEAKIITKKGDKISEKACDIMSKLGIKPFLIGFIPVVALDKTEGKIYTEIKIDRKETLEKLKSAYGRALPFAVNIAYTTPETIGFILGKAGMHAKALEKFGGIKNE
jgi:large subunit ribosomal protein L10